MEIAFKILSIGEFYFTSAFLGVFDEHAFVVFPVIFKQVKVGKIEATVQFYGVVIIDFSKPMELILTPVSFISQFPTLIEKFSPSIHLITFPLPLIIPPILIKELTMAIPLAIQLIPFIFRARLILLHNILMISQIHCLPIPYPWAGILRVLIPDLNYSAVVFGFLYRTDWGGFSVMDVIVNVIIVRFWGWVLGFDGLFGIWGGVNVVGAFVDVDLWLWVIW